MIRLISLVLIVLAPVLLILVEDPAAVFGVNDAQAIRLGFGAILLGLVALAAYLNLQTREDPFRLMTSWLAGTVAIVLIAAHHRDILPSVQPPEPRSASVVQNSPPKSVELVSPKSPVGTFEIKASANGNFLTNGEVNGEHLDMIVDTGATYVTLRYEDAESLGLDPAELRYSIALKTANGESTGAGVILDEVSVGGIPVENVPAIVVEEGALGISLLGMSYLSKIGGFQASGDTFTLED